MLSNRNTRRLEYDNTILKEQIRKLNKQCEKREQELDDANKRIIKLETLLAQTKTEACLKCLKYDDMQNRIYDLEDEKRILSETLKDGIILEIEKRVKKEQLIYEQQKEELLKKLSDSYQKFNRQIEHQKSIYDQNLQIYKHKYKKICAGQKKIIDKLQQTISSAIIYLDYSSGNLPSKK